MKICRTIGFHSSVMKSSRQRHKARAKNCKATWLTLGSPRRLAVTETQKDKWSF